MKVGEFLDRWLDDVVKQKRSRGHWRNCESHIRLHIKPAIGHTQLAKLTPLQVERVLSAVRAKGVGADTVRLVHATLRAALTVARRWGLVHDNVASLVEPISVHRAEVRPFSDEEIGRLMAAAAGDRMGAFLTVALSLGLRPGEARAVRWADVDLGSSHPHLRVGAAFSRAKGGQQLGEPKARSRRTVPLPEQCVAALRVHQDRQRIERELASSEWNESGFVFTTARGAPLTDKAVSVWFQRLRERAGIDHGRLYDCRHTAASLLLAQGIHPRVIMEVLGHSTFRLTMDTYAHVLPPGLEEAARAMNTAIVRAQRSSEFGGQFGGQGDGRARGRDLSPSRNSA
jgi:integrase